MVRIAASSSICGPRCVAIPLPPSRSRPETSSTSPISCSKAFAALARYHFHVSHSFHLGPRRRKGSAAVGGRARPIRDPSRRSLFPQICRNTAPEALIITSWSWLIELTGRCVTYPAITGFPFLRSPASPSRSKISHRKTLRQSPAPGTPLRPAFLPCSSPDPKSSR